MIVALCGKAYGEIDQHDVLLVSSDEWLAGCMVGLRWLADWKAFARAQEARKSKGLEMRCCARRLWITRSMRFEQRKTRAHGHMRLSIRSFFTLFHSFGEAAGCRCIKDNVVHA